MVLWYRAKGLATPATLAPLHHSLLQPPVRPLQHLYLLKLVGAKNKIRVAATLALNQLFGRDLTCEC